MLNYILIFTSIILGVAGQLTLKQGASQIGGFDFSKPLEFAISAFTNLYVLGGLALYFISALVWIVALSKVDLSFAYPLVSIGYILVLIFSSILFKEKVLPIHWLGVLLILGGVVLITRGR